MDDDGQVTFSDLPADLAEVAALLDPDAALACPAGIPAKVRPRRGPKPQ